MNLLGWPIPEVAFRFRPELAAEKVTQEFEMMEFHPPNGRVTPQEAKFENKSCCIHWQNQPDLLPSRFTRDGQHRSIRADPADQIPLKPKSCPSFSEL
jgi:hypothetical protein